MIPDVACRRPWTPARAAPRTCASGRPPAVEDHAAVLGASRPAQRDRGSGPGGQVTGAKNKNGSTAGCADAGPAAACLTAHTGPKGMKLEPPLCGCWIARNSRYPGLSSDSSSPTSLLKIRASYRGNTLGSAGDMASNASGPSASADIRLDQLGRSPTTYHSRPWGTGGPGGNLARKSVSVGRYVGRGRN